MSKSLAACDLCHHPHHLSQACQWGDCDCDGIDHITDLSFANARQHGGDHYRLLPIQPWDYIAANGLGFFDGTALKYLTRWRQKGGVEDLRKAIHFIEKLIELETAGTAPKPRQEPA